jgi:hypothetical protein
MFLQNPPRSPRTLPLVILEEFGFALHLGEQLDERGLRLKQRRDVEVSGDRVGCTWVRCQLRRFKGIRIATCYHLVQGHKHPLALSIARTHLIEFESLELGHEWWSFRSHCCLRASMVYHQNKIKMPTP